VECMSFWCSQNPMLRAHSYLLYFEWMGWW
jgi:hypothetical protein